MPPQGRSRAGAGTPEAIGAALAAVETALGYIENFVGTDGYAVGSPFLTWADGALVPQLMLAFEWAPRLFAAPSPVNRFDKIAAYWRTIPGDPIVGRLIAETREAVAQEGLRAKALAAARTAQTG